MLSRYEETLVPARDVHDRFPADASYAYRGQFLDYPIIDVYLEILWRCMATLWPGLRRRSRTSRAFVSCDVDTIRDEQLRTLGGVVRRVGHFAIRRRAAGASLATLRASASIFFRGLQGDPYHCFDYYMRCVEEAGMRAAFYMMAGKTDERYDATYSLREPVVQALLSSIHARGHELGLHPSYNSYRSLDVLERELAALRDVCRELRIEQSAYGGRQHFLRWEPQTWSLWARAGLSYDSTLTYAEQSGFRAGVCFEYSAYDLQRRCVLPLTVRPLIAMDMTLLAPGYMGLSHANAAARLRLYMRLCRQFNGDFSLLWHNSMLLEKRDRALFESVLNELAL
jgi:hypothetical protein